jgi:uncharacterized surface protein with fasciclin (FAS1) repeats
MWFVAALLVFSLVYAAWRGLRPAPQRPGPVRLGALLVGAGLVIAVASLAVWQVWPWNSSAFRTLRPGEWPQGAVLFALGVHAGETRWLENLPPALVRRLGWVAATGSAATVALFAFRWYGTRRRRCWRRPPGGPRPSERRVFRAVFGAGVRDPLAAEEILLYHLVRGDTMTHGQLRAAAPTSLATMQGGILRVRIRDGRLTLLDVNPAYTDARTLPLLRNINRGNRQIAHGVDAVLSESE